MAAFPQIQNTRNLTAQNRKKYPDAFRKFRIPDAVGRQHRHITHVRKDFIERIKASQQIFCDHGWIYCFLAESHQDYHWMKIGRTTNLKQRLRSYTGPSAVKKIVGLFETESLRMTETKMLAGFSEHHEKINGEWFKIPNAELTSAKKLFAELFSKL